MSAANPSADRNRRLEKGWTDYRRRQWFAGLMTIGFIPLAAIIGLSVETLARSESLISFFVAALAVFAFGSWSSWPRMEDVELATLAWVDWYNHRRLLSSIDYRTPAQAQADYYQPQSALPEAA